MRYGIRYNAKKKKLEYLSVDEINPSELLDIIEADDYFAVQKTFKEYIYNGVNSFAYIDSIREAHGNQYIKEIEAAIRNYKASLGLDR